MVDLISEAIPYLVLLAHFAFIALFLAIIFRNFWGNKFIFFLGRHAILIAFFLSLFAIIGSLFYSEIVGFEPCVLCWWQRVFLYPSALLLGMALFKKDRLIFRYAAPLVLLSTVVALYQYYVTSLGGTSILACTDAGGACSKVYVKAFGYITIEMMSLTISLLVLLMAWVNKIYVKENSNS